MKQCRECRSRGRGRVKGAAGHLQELEFLLQQFHLLQHLIKAFGRHFDFLQLIHPSDFAFCGSVPSVYTHTQGFRMGLLSSVRCVSMRQSGVRKAGAALRAELAAPIRATDGQSAGGAQKMACGLRT